MTNETGKGARNEEGFTLIEMMVVVTIIGILAAVAIPRYISYVKTSQTAEVGQMAGTLVSAMQAYADQQNMTPADAQALFDTYAVNLDAAPTKDLTKLLPQLSLPPSTNFNYTISTKVSDGAAGAPAPNDVVYCIVATGRPSTSLPGGVVVYSSSPASSTTDSAAGWNGRLNNTLYLQGVTNATSAPAGGYCATGGKAAATFS